MEPTLLDKLDEIVARLMDLSEELKMELIRRESEREGRYGKDESTHKIQAH